jgi:1,2-dihydroxy-3-keto-5-methylthiopentene dioxygenase
MRLFKDEPKWTPLNRSTNLDENDHRVNYVNSYLNQTASTKVSV